MTLLDVYWTPKVNMLRARCVCGRVADFRVDRWWLRCAGCKRAVHVDRVRCQQIS